MSDQAVEILITNAIHTAFIKYPEGDGGPDYEWIAPDQSVHIAKAILQDLAVNGEGQSLAVRSDALTTASLGSEHRYADVANS